MDCCITDATYSKSNDQLHGAMHGMPCLQCSKNSLGQLLGGGTSSVAPAQLKLRTSTPGICPDGRAQASSSQLVNHCVAISVSRVHTSTVLVDAGAPAQEGCSGTSCLIHHLCKVACEVEEEGVIREVEVWCGSGGACNRL